MKNSIDLSQWLDQEVCATLRNGSTIIARCMVNKYGCSDSYPYWIGGGSYARQGVFHENFIDHAADIVEICPASSVTLLKWTSDQRPTKADAHMTLGMVQVHTDGFIGGALYSEVKEGQEWAHCPNWRPSVADPLSSVEQQLAVALKRIEALEARLG